jgi:hypothetical protein
MICGEICIEIIWKKEGLQHGKHDEELDKDNGPQLFANPHLAEAITIKGIDIMDHATHLLIIITISKCL